LFGLGVFSVVNVLPDLGGEDQSVIPVKIELAQSKFRQLKVGGGLLVESGKQDIHVSAEFRHVNLFNRLIRGTLSSRVGFTTLGTLSDIPAEGLLAEVTTTSGPTALGGLEIEVPRFPARSWRSTTSFTAELGVEEGYRYWTPEFSPGLSWRVGPQLTLGFSYHLRYFDYLALTLDESDLGRTRLGLDFTDPYLLSFLRQKLTVDRRDHVLFTRRGTYGLFQVSEAGGPFGGQFNFVRLDADQRAYLPVRGILRSRGTIAGRAAGGLILPYGADDERARVPYAERLYLGGGSSARGWVRNHLGPYICDPDQAIECVGQFGQRQPTGEILPLGGTLSLLGGIEARAYAPRDWGIAVFSDLGMAWDTPADLQLNQLQPSAGAGLRYKSPIGPVRFDVAARLRDEPMYAEEPKFTVHFSLAEAY
jgi:outer membrane translocation and assembly module TamA